MTGRANAISIPAPIPLPVTSAMTTPTGRRRRCSAEQLEEVAADLAGRLVVARQVVARHDRSAERHEAALRESAPGPARTPTRGSRLRPAPRVRRPVRRALRRPSGRRSRGRSPRRARRGRPRNGCPAPACRPVPRRPRGPGGLGGRGDRIAGHVDHRDPQAIRRGGEGGQDPLDARGVERGAGVGHGRPGRRVRSRRSRSRDRDGTRTAGPARSARARGSRRAGRRTAGPPSGVRHPRRRWSTHGRRPSRPRGRAVRSPCIRSTIAWRATSPELAMNVNPERSSSRSGRRRRTALEPPR